MYFNYTRHDIIVFMVCCAKNFNKVFVVQFM